MYVATAAAAAAQNGVGTHLLVAPLLQLHQCEQVHLIQWNPIDSGTVAVAVAAPSERTFKPYPNQVSAAAAPSYNADVVI